MAALITPTRLGIARRLQGAMRAAYLRALIAAAEADVHRMQCQLAFLPLQIEVHKDYIAGLRVDLIDAEAFRPWQVNKVPL